MFKIFRAACANLLRILKNTHMKNQRCMLKILRAARGLQYKKDMNMYKYIV